MSKQLSALIMACEMRSLQLARQASKEWLDRFFSKAAPASIAAEKANISKLGRHYGLVL